MKEKNLIFPQEIEGWLWLEECEVLYNLAQLNQDLGCIVELGSFRGKSTICLAQGSKKVGGGKVYAIDNFVGDKYTGRSESFLGDFRKNIEVYKLEDDVESIEGDFSKIAEKWSKPIRLLFIDGSHDYEEVKRDFNNWEKFAVVGGVIALHDALVWAGVTRFVRELIKAGRFKDFKTINSPGSLTYIVKLSESDKISTQEVKDYLSEFDKLANKRKLARVWGQVRKKLNFK